jgi:hypothetical protein
MKDLASKFYMSENTGFFKILYGHLKLSRLYSFVISTIRKMTSIFFYAEQEKNEMVGKYMVSMKQLNCVLGSYLTLIFSCMSGPQFIFLEKGQMIQKFYSFPSTYKRQQESSSILWISHTDLASRRDHSLCDVSSIGINICLSYMTNLKITPKKKMLWNLSLRIINNVYGTNKKEY